MPVNKNSCAQNVSSEEHISYERMPENIKINCLGRLITAISLATEHQDSKEYAQLQDNKEELEELKELMQEILHNDSTAMALDTCKSQTILQFIQKNQEHLKAVSSSLYLSALQAIMQGKNQEFPEHPISFPQHPLAFYAQLLNDFVETRFFSLSEDAGTIITHAFNYCCQKLYNECVKLEESITKKLITNVVDCMWTFALVEKNKNEIIYVLGGWRYANLMVILEELRQKYADQSIENLDDSSMLKLMEALTAGASLMEDNNDEGESEDTEDDDEEDDGCCCHGCK